MEVCGLDRSELDLEWVWWREGVGLGLGLDGNQVLTRKELGFDWALDRPGFWVASLPG